MCKRDKLKGNQQNLHFGFGNQRKRLVKAEFKDMFKHGMVLKIVTFTETMNSRVGIYLGKVTSYNFK